MLIRNDTPFAALGFGDLHRDGIGMAVVAVRGPLRPLRRGALQPRRHPDARAQRRLCRRSPSHAARAGRGPDSLQARRRRDRPRPRPRTPGGRPARSWTVALTVANAGGAAVPRAARLATGAALSCGRPGSSARSEPHPVPLDYRLAAAGASLGIRRARRAPTTRSARGQLHRDWSPVGRCCRRPGSRRRRRPSPIPSQSRARRLRPGAAVLALARGALRHPRRGVASRALPADACGFRLPFLPETAAPALIRPRLHGDETVRLDGLVPGGALTVPVAGLVPVAHHAWFDGRAVSARLHLDGVHLDLRAEAAPWRVDLTWRGGWVARCPAYITGRCWRWRRWPRRRAWRCRASTG